MDYKLLHFGIEVAENGFILHRHVPEGTKTLPIAITSVHPTLLDLQQALEAAVYRHREEKGLTDAPES